MKVWCYFGADGRTCADSSFRDRDEAWRVMLGWPTVGEVRNAQARGDRVAQVEILPPEDWIAPGSTPSDEAEHK